MITIFVGFMQGGKALEVEVEEEAALGTVAGYVSATDNDSGDNALIDYRITGKYFDEFAEVETSWKCW